MPPHQRSDSQHGELLGEQSCVFHMRTTGLNSLNHTSVKESKEDRDNVPSDGESNFLLMELGNQWLVN